MWATSAIFMYVTAQSKQSPIGAGVDVMMTNFCDFCQKMAFF
jgi:hypothetical protein